MAYKVEFEAETVRFKVLCSNEGNIEKIKLNIKSSGVLPLDLTNGLNFLKQMRLNINKRHEGRLTLDELLEYRGHVGEIELVPDVHLVVVDDSNQEWLSVNHLGVYGPKLKELNVANYMVDLIVALYGYYNEDVRG